MLRINSEILICDPEEAYVKKLAEVLILRKEINAGIRICSSLEMLEKLLEIGKVKVLLISEEIPYESRKRIFRGRRIVLTQQHCEDIGDEETELMKYQSADQLIAVILKVFQGSGGKSGYRGSTQTKIIGVYSPIHRIGKTNLTLKLGKLLAEEQNVLYLNLESYAGIGGYFREKGDEDFSNLLYYAKQEQDDVSVRMTSLTKQLGRLDYVPPAKMWTDLMAISPEEWKDFLNTLSVQSVYEIILLDIGDGVSNVFEVLKLCDQIFMPFLDDVHAKTKMKQYRYMLKTMGIMELDNKTTMVNMEKNLRQNIKELAELIGM